MEDIFVILEEARSYFAKKNYDKAKPLFLKFIETHTGFADVYSSLAMIYYIEDDYEKSIEYYEKAISINPNYSEAIMNIIVVLHHVGEIEKTEKYLDKLKEIKSVKGTADRYCMGKLSNMHAEIAEVYKTMLLYDEAIAEYEKALKLSPAFPDIRLNYAITLRDAGKVEDAIYEFDKVLIDKNNYVDAYVNLGVSYYKLGYLGFAIDAWQKGYQLDPNNKVLQSFLFILDNAEEIS
jgi:tetratricopeptide (TPR) repeat protein